MTDENKVAEASAAAVAEPEFDPADQYTWSPEQREHWNETGEPPEPPKKPKQESAPAATPAKEAKSEPEGKTAAESETAPKQGKKERKPGEKLSADERIAQLTAKVRDLEAGRERSRSTEPKPSAAQPEPAKQPEAPKRPNPFNWKGTAEEYDAAVETWEKYQREQAIQAFQRDAAAEVQKQKLQGQLDEVKQKYPGAQEKIAETFEAFAKVNLPGVIRSMFEDSECLPELMYVLSDEETRTNFIETATKNPGKAIRALAQMEKDIFGRRSAPTNAEHNEKSESKTPVEPKPRAPKPPSEVGGRGAAADDELRAAAASGDFRAFEAEQNRRKFARPA